MRKRVKWFPKKNDGFANHPALALLLTFFNIAGLLWTFHLFQNPPGSYSYPQSSAGSGTVFSSGTIIDVTQAPYNVGTGIIATDGTFTSGQPTVVFTTTVPSTNWVGWIYKATNGCCGGLNHTTGVHEFAAGTILSVNPATKTITLSQNALANVNPGTTNGTIFGAGPDATAGLTAAWTASQAGVNAIPVQLPGGPVFSKKGQFNTTGNAKLPLSGSASPDIQAEILGWGGYSSLIVMAEGFDFTTGTGNSCGGDSGGGNHTTCFGGIQALRAMNWGVTALSDSAAGGTSTNVFIAHNDSQFFNMTCIGFGAANSSFTSGMVATLGTQPIIGLQLDGCGYLSLFINNATNPIFMSDSFVGDTVGSALDVEAGKIFFSNANVYFGPTTLTNGTIGLRGTLYSTGDWIGPAAGGITINMLASGAAAHLDNDILGQNGTPVTGLNIIAGTSVSASHTTITASGNIVARAGTGLYQDLGDNTYNGGGSLSQIQPTCAQSAGNGTCAALAGSTNEKGTIRITAGTTTSTNPSFTMTFAGTFSGASANSPTCTFELAQTGTGSWVTAAPAVTGLPMQTAVSPASVTEGITTTVGLTAASTYDVVYQCRPN